MRNELLSYKYHVMKNNHTLSSNSFAPRSIITKIIQVTLKKENGSFGIVIRGGDHELLRKRRPFTVVHVNQQGPAYAEGTIRKGDRIRAINGSNLASTRLPELQGLLYQQDKVKNFRYFAYIYIAIAYPIQP